MELEVKVQRKPSKFGKYKAYSITIPSQVLKQIPRLKRAKKVRLDINLLGNIEIKV